MWRYKPQTCTLEWNQHYEIDLERCRTAAQVLDWIMQVAGKAWVTDKCLAGLVHALDELLHPQETMCSMAIMDAEPKSPLNVRAYLNKENTRL